MLSTEHSPRITVIGIGGAGGNAVQHMISQGDVANDYTFIAANTDKQALLTIPQDIALPIGERLTGGLGAGAKPSVGYQAAQESQVEIKNSLAGADMIFLTAGMGGGTGTGASPVVADIARKIGALTIAVVTRPFAFEGQRRATVANEGIQALTEQVDALIVVPNDRLLTALGSKASILTAFETCNDVLRYAVNGIAEMISQPGMINVDFADVRTVFSHQGRCKIGMGAAEGENRAEEATYNAINSPLIEQKDIKDAKGILINITSGPDLSIGEFNQVGEIIRSFVNDSTTMVTGTSVDLNSNAIKVTLVASGLPAADNVKPETSHQPAAPAKTEKTVVQEPRPTRSLDETSMDYLDIPAFLRR